MKPVDALTVVDLREHSVWQYTRRGPGDETWVRPVKRLPVTNLTGKLVGTQVVLANGTPVWALMGNVDASNPRLTAHFRTLSVERGGTWFHLARYHDFDANERGPEQLATFLDLAVDDVFPISYDLLPHSKGDPKALRGTIQAKPSEVLTRDQIIALAVPRPALD